MTSESTRFLGQPNEIKPTEGAVGGDDLVTYSLYRLSEFEVGRKCLGLGVARCDESAVAVIKSISAGSYAT